MQILIFVSTVAIFFYECRKGYFSKFGSFFKNIQPSSYFRLLFLSAALSVGLFFADVRLLEIIQSFQHPFFKLVINCGAWLGRGCNMWLLVIACYFLFKLLKNNLGSRLTFGVLLSVTLSTTFSFIVKRTFMRARPYNHFGAFSFFHLNGLLHDKNAFQSFPSGDVALVAGAAAFLFYATKNSYTRWLLLIFPVATAFSRIWLDRHWPSDTLFSVGLGFIAGLFIWQYQKHLESLTP